MKLRLDTILSAIMIGAFFLPWVQYPQASEDSIFGKQVTATGYSLSSDPEIQLLFLYIVPALAIIVFLTSFLRFNNRWLRILAGLIPLGTVVWAVTFFSKQMNFTVMQFLEILPGFLNWGFYISLACALGLLLNGLWALKPRRTN